MNKYKILLHLVIVLSLLIPRESKAQVTGRVSDEDGQPIPHVHVIVRPTGWGTLTDASGRFRIHARPGNILLFSHVAMKPESVRVFTRFDEINVSLQLAEIELAEAEIRAEKNRAHKSQKELLAEFPDNKNLVKTWQHIIDKDLSSSFFRIIDGKDLLPGNDFLYSLQAFVPSLSVYPDITGFRVGLRGFGGGPVSPLFDVDGFIFHSVPTYLSGFDIDRVAVMERNAAIMHYGPQGAAGVIVINTKAKTEIDDRGVIRTYDNRALVDSLKRATTYLDPYHPPEPKYLEKLKTVKRVKKAWTIYEKEKEEQLRNPYYFLDVYDLFLSRWGNTRLSLELLEEVREHLPEDVPLLKALAYLHQQYKQKDAAVNQYVQILLAQSWEAQALRDLANALAEAGDIERAWMYYTQYIDIQDQLPGSSFDALGEDLLIATEMRGILNRYSAPFLDQYEMEDFLLDDLRTRLVFEWNQQDAEFELQFVTPQKFYDTWDQKAPGEASLDTAAVKDYCSKQFFLAGESPGLWEINMDYKGNSSGLPTYLKVSVYHNFGLPDQTLEVKVFKLTGEQRKGQLLTIQQN